MKTIDSFIDEVVKLYKLASPTAMVKRELKFKLGMADIRVDVKEEDTSLALDIVLGSLKKAPKGILRTASAGTRYAGTCPRCHNLMIAAKLVDSRAVGYCETCRVAVASI